MSGPRLGIAGLGLIGGSIALRSRRAAPDLRIVGFDADPATLELALDRGAIDAAASSLKDLAAGCDTLVIALPVDATDAALDALAGLQGPDLVIDVASVKGPFVRHVASIGTYVGTHPMAGRERGGLDAADAALFCDAAWAYTPHPNARLVALTRAFIEAMGARPFEIDAVRHDRIVALTSHLPQALSVILGAELAGAAGEADVIDLCGPGMMSLLRLARSPEAIWSPIFSANAAPLAERLRSIARELEIAAAALQEGDSDQLMSYFRPAREVTAALEQRTPLPSRSSSYRCSQPRSSPTPPPAR